MKDDRLYLLHISESLERIEEYVAEAAEASPPHRPVGRLCRRGFHQGAVEAAVDVQLTAEDLKRVDDAALQGVAAGLQVVYPSASLILLPLTTAQISKFPPSASTYRRRVETR